MGRLRCWLRLLLIAIATALFYPTWRIGRFLLFVYPSARARWRSVTFGIWARAVLRIMNVEVEVVGEVPAPPFLLVSNHLGYFDIVVLASRVHAVFVSKNEVRSWPVVGFMVEGLDTIFVDRSLRSGLPRVIERIEQALDSDQGVVMFPEGTSTAGASVAAFRPSLLEVAARGRLPVSSAALSYSTPAGQPSAHLAVCWWGDMTFTDHFLRLLALPGFSARVAFGRETVREGDRKRLASRLEKNVRELFVPVPGAAS